MRVILGNVGKSRVLESQMKQLNRDRTLMIDSVGLNAIAHLAAYNVPVNSFTETIVALSELEKDTDLLKKIDCIVLSLNAFINDSETFLNWERRLEKNFVITIQEKDVDRVLMFDMSLPD